MNFGKEKSFVPKVMIVDDDKLIRDMYKEYFDNLGHETLSCCDGKSALNQAKTFSPDIVIADLKMPGINGIELMNKVKELLPDIEVIIVTGAGDMEDSIKSFRDGAVDFLTKPVDPNCMMTAYNNAVKRIILKRSEKASPQESRALMKSLINTYDSEKKRAAESIEDKLNTIIYPQIDKLADTSDSGNVQEGLKFIKDLLTEYFSNPYTSSKSFFSDLTPVEAKICDLISQWKNPQEISELLNLSVHTVYDHRKRIRKKLGLEKSKESLDQYVRAKRKPEDIL